MGVLINQNSALRQQNSHLFEELDTPRRMIPTIGSDRIPIGSDHGSIGIFINRRNPIGFRVAIRHPDP